MGNNYYESTSEGESVENRSFTNNVLKRDEFVVLTEGRNVTWKPISFIAKYLFVK